MRKISIDILYVVLSFCLSSDSFALNGFDLQNSSIPASQILPGGPPKDGIPAIDSPRFISAKKADYLHPNDPVLGIAIGAMAKAYPIRILNYHEIVNDRFSHQAIVISYCPLCGTGVAFEATVDQEVLQFGVSGLLYNSDVLLYDRQSQSLWSQLLKRAISGPKKDKKLKAIAMRHTTWREWRKLHPQTVVLSLQTGYNRDYSRSPYGNYDLDKSIYFPVAHQDRRYHPKERILGIEIKGRFKVYPFVELAKASKGSDLTLTDHFMGRRLILHYDKVNNSAWIEIQGKEYPSIIGFWFAWMAFHPESQVYKYND